MQLQVRQNADSNVTQIMRGTVLAVLARVPGIPAAALQIPTKHAQQ